MSQSISRNVNKLWNYILYAQKTPRGRVVLCGTLFGSCFCHPKYQCSVSRLLLTMKKAFERWKELPSSVLGVGTRAATFDPPTPS